MNEDELYRLAELAFKAKIRELGIPQGPQRDSLWNSIIDQLEAMPPEQLQKISQEVPAEQPGMMRRLGDFFNERTRNAETMDREEGTTGFDRLATGAVYGAINAPHMLAKGVTGIGRMLGWEGPANRYKEWSQGFQDDYDKVTPYLGKTGMAGEMLGSLPTDIPLYASGMGVAAKVPRIGRMLGSGSRMTRLGGEILGNAGVDFAQGAVIGAGDEGAGVGDMFANGLVNTGVGSIANVGMAGVGAGARAATRRAGTRAMDGLPPDYIDGVIAAELAPRQGPREQVWSNPNEKNPFNRPVRTPTPTTGMDLLATMMGRAPQPAADEMDVVQMANRAYAHKTRNRRPQSFAP